MRKKPPQPLVLVPVQDGEYDYGANINEMSDKIQEFLYGVSKGYSTVHACALSGCDSDMMHRWLSPRQKNYKPKLHILFKRARAVFYARQVDKVANSRDWRAAALWLERHEADWNPKETTRIVGIGDGVPMIKMDSDTIAALSNAYDERMKKADPARQSANDKDAESQSIS